MSKFYDEMRKTALDLLHEFGTTMTLATVDDVLLGYGIICYLKPKPDMNEVPMERSYITKSNQKRAFLLMHDITVIPEMGHKVTSNYVSRTISKIDPVAPADELVVYECILEV